jgi:large subunit ribosomal protein L17
MRHKVSGRHLGRTTGHRTALRRNLAASLFEHGTISTTSQKAKFVKPFAEKLITLAKGGTLHGRRRAISMLQDRDICNVEDGEPVKVDTVIRKLFNEIGPRFAQRNGGYTRIVSLPFRRIGDNGQLVLLQLVEDKKARVVETSSDSAVESDTSVDTATSQQEIPAETESVESAEEVEARKTDAPEDSMDSTDASDSGGEPEDGDDEKK